MEAIQRYGILTIGDGLVAQIPALLGSMTAGLVVTRVSFDDEDSNLGKDIAAQVLAQPKAFAIASGLLCGIGLVPGMPAVSFFIMAISIGSMSYGVMHSKAGSEGDTFTPNQVQAKGEETR